MAKARKLDAEATKNILSVLRRGRGITTGARIAGVSRQAIYKKMLRSKRFKDQVDEATTSALESVEGALWDAATGQAPAPGKVAPNVPAAIYYTKNRDRVNWGDKREDDNPNTRLTVIEMIAEVERKYIEGLRTKKPDSSPEGEVSLPDQKKQSGSSGA